MEQLNLNWHTYNDHLKDLMQSLLHLNHSSDVTLICEDKTKLKAHKFVLNACSPVFQAIIDDLPQSDPVIYLRGVFASEMKSILQFIYLGQTTLHVDGMNDFLKLARSLEIKEISQNVDFDDNEFPVQDQICDNSGKSNVQNIEFNYLHEDKTIVKSSETGKEKKTILTNHSNARENFPCELCDKQFSYRRSLKQHIRSAHEGIKFHCENCGYEATTKQNLLSHIQNIHEGIKYPCSLCDYKTSFKGNLDAHKRNKHLSD